MLAVIATDRDDLARTRDGRQQPDAREWPRACRARRIKVFANRLETRATCEKQPQHRRLGAGNASDGQGFLRLMRQGQRSNEIVDDLHRITDHRTHTDARAITLETDQLHLSILSEPEPETRTRAPQSVRQTASGHRGARSGSLSAACAMARRWSAAPALRRPRRPGSRSCRQ